MSISFDLPNRPLSFFAFHALYREWSYMIASWSVCLAILTAFFHLAACYIFASSAILSLCFIGLLTLFYELSQHTPSSYTEWRRFLIVMLGYWSIVTFSAGLIVGSYQFCNRGLLQ